MAGLSWLITFAIAIVAGLACYASNLEFAPTLVPISLVQAFFGLAVFLFYLVFRSDFFILSVANGIALLSTFSFALPLFSYVALHDSTAFELKDGTLASIDAAFGLDWVSLAMWANDHPWIARIMDVAYSSIPIQTLCALMILSLLGQYRRFQMLVLATQVCALICAMVTAFIPAVGEYAYLNINPSLTFPWLPSVATSYVAPVAEIVQLRTSAPLVQLDHLMGVITFPSFHAAAGLLFIWGMWKVSVVRWLSLVLNGFMLVATPVFGGHYFADVAAGLLVATFSIYLAHGAVRFFQKKERVFDVAPKTETAVEQLAN
jgi:hypothetical protein